MDKFPRRTVLGGLAAAAVAPAARADSPLAHGVLENNRLAQAFVTAPRRLPAVKIVGPAGTRALRDLVGGRTLIMPLWAEWCAPCMIELPEFARLQAKYGSERFAIMPILTATQHVFSPESLRGILKSLVRLDVFEPLMEDRAGDRLMWDMAVRQAGVRLEGSGAALPCNLVIGPDGEVKGRIFGDRDIQDSSATKAKTYDDAVNRAQNGQIQTIWGSADGDAFVAALAQGFLTTG
jgi:thiol-disulfide isomerase/thioredoxin